MKKATLIIAISLIYTIGYAGSGEPCKGVIVPETIQSNEVIFEIPTYDEYVHGVVLESLSNGIFTDEKNILNEATFSKVRASKVKSIETTYTNEYKIMTKKEVQSAGVSDGFIFQEKLVADLVTDTNIKFEQYTTFTLKDVTTSTQYTLVDPSKDASSNCIVKKGAYKFDDLISIIQK